MQLMWDVLGLVMIALPALALFAYVRSVHVVSVPRNRAEQNGIRAFAKGSGFSISVSENKKKSLLTSLADFPLFFRGDDGRITLLMRRRAADISIASFDYQWASGLGQAKKFSTQTVILLQFNKFVLPSFTLHPQTIATKMFGRYFDNTVDLTKHRSFSEKYLIRSPDEESVRTLFDSATCSYLEGIAPVSLEARADTLIIYRSSVVVPACKMEAFLEEALYVSTLFTGA